MRIVLFAVIGAFVAILPAAAAEIPDRVRREAEDARALCLKNGGTTGPIEAAAIDYDVNGDGIKDWIVDPRRLNCRGSHPQVCGEQCSFHLFLGQRDGTVRPSMHIVVVAWDVGRTMAGKPALFLTQADDDCIPRRKSCRNTFIFERGLMIHLQPDPRGRK